MDKTQAGIPSGLTARIARLAGVSWTQVDECFRGNRKPGRNLQEIAASVMGKPAKELFPMLRENP